MPQRWLGCLDARVPSILQASGFLTKPVDFDLIQGELPRAVRRNGLTERGEGAVQELDDPKPRTGGWTWGHGCRAWACQIVIALSGSTEPRTTLHITRLTYTNVRSRDDPTLRRRGREGPQWVGLTRSTNYTRTTGFGASRSLPRVPVKVS
jgi:hypothetical protein